MPSFPRKRESSDNIADEQEDPYLPSFPRKRESSGRGRNTRDGTRGFQTAS